MSLSNGSDLALELPLQGVQLIEASAGTGKTHTLAGIYTRLIVECRFAVRQILVVTFTKAATEELKSRLRTRLLLCAEVVRTPCVSAGRRHLQVDPLRSDDCLHRSPTSRAGHGNGRVELPLSDRTVRGLIAADKFTG